jgi:hypothetical protein
MAVGHDLGSSLTAERDAYYKLAVRRLLRAKTVDKKLRPQFAHASISGGGSLKHPSTAA